MNFESRTTMFARQQETARLLAENEHLRAELMLRRRLMARFPFCPDHMDKVDGLDCRQCEIDRLRAELEAHTLRKQTGPVPECGWYIIGDVAGHDGYFVRLFKGDDPQEDWKQTTWWVGPVRVEEAKTNRDADLITVCAHCLRASCWQGKFYCDKFKTAGTVQKTCAELQSLGLEHPCYWLTDDELATSITQPGEPTPPEKPPKGTDEYEGH